METTKTCIVCKQSFPATPQYFTCDRSRPDGLHPYCKTCRNARRVARRQASQELTSKNRERANAWYYANHERAHEKRKQQYATNREQAIEYSRQWRIANPDRYRETMKACKHKHYRNNREQYAAYVRNRRARVQGASGSHTAADIKAMLESQDGKCYYCGCALVEYHVDHVIPVSRGGSNDPDNLVIACPTCNCSKNDRLLSEWSPILHG